MLWSFHMSIRDNARVNFEREADLIRLSIDKRGARALAHRCNLFPFLYQSLQRDMNYLLNEHAADSIRKQLAVQSH